MNPNRRSALAAPTRRRLLAAGAGLAGLALAGCVGSGTAPTAGASGRDGGAPTAGDEPGAAVSPATTSTPAGDGFRDHPAAAAIDDQPRKGPAPEDAEAVIVAFEDPSCTRCRAFERQVVPRIESELIGTGRATLYFRGYPVIYPWGEPATHALEATYARDADAFWALKDHYYAEQDAFTSDNVLGRTRSFLAEATGVDADGVVADVESGATEPAVRTDLEAGEAAGAGRTTPIVFLFSGGEYRTKAAGSVSYAVIENALDL